MLSGIYSTNFMSNQNLLGSGVVVFTGGFLHGGDASYYYKGKYRIHDGNRVSAEVEVVNHSGTPSSVFGPIDRFRLTLNGTMTADKFTISGQIKDAPQMMIAIALKKLDELVEA